MTYGSCEYWQDKIMKYRSARTHDDSNDIDQKFYEEVAEYATKNKKLTPKLGDSQLFYQTIFLLNTIGFAEEE